MAAAASVLALAACGQVQTLEVACRDHGGVRPGSVERENNGGAEARCADNTEAENAESSSPTADGWKVEE